MTKKMFPENQSFVFVFRDCSSTISSKQDQSTNSKNCELINIIHHELNKPSSHPSISTKHIAIQCSSDDFNSEINHSDSVLIGHSSSTKPLVTSSIPILPGYNECGIQVDLNEDNMDLLIEIYSNRLSVEIIRHFYEVCHSDIQLTRTEIDEYLQHHSENQRSFPTLSQLSLNALNRWNEQIKSTNPLSDTRSINDLLEDINDDEIFEELTLDNNTTPTTNAAVIHSNQINLSWSMINSLEDLYGELPNKSSLSSDNNGIVLPIDDDLSLSMYQTLQRFLRKPVNENQIKKKNKTNNTNNQKWKLPSQTQSNSTNISSFQQIINEEQQAANSQKSKKVFTLI